MRSIYLGLIALVWLLLGYFFHQKYMNDCCSGNAKDKTSMSNDRDAKPSAESTAITAGKTAVKATGPILFNYGKNGTVLGDGWQTYKADLLKGMKSDELLEITGRYTADEKAPSGFANMGEARADESRKALGLAADKVILKGVQSTSGVDKENPYEAVAFKRVAGTPKTLEEDLSGISKIRFPYNSTNKLRDTEVEQFLDRVAKQVKSSGNIVKLVGHTDNRGEDSYNKSLGQRRANIIRDYLVSKGVNGNKIRTSSMGEASPIASNSNEAGRAENRRTELEIIK